MLCGERWMRCTVRNKWWRIKIEKDKERHNTETQRSQRRVRTKAPERFGGLLFRKKKEGRPDRVGAPLRELVEPLFVVAGIAAGATFGRGGGGASAASGCLLLLLAGFLDEGFARKADFVAFDRENLYEDLVA